MWLEDLYWTMQHRPQFLFLDSWYHTLLYASPPYKSKYISEHTHLLMSCFFSQPSQDSSLSTHNPVQSLVWQLVFARPPSTPHTLSHQSNGMTAYSSSPPCIPPGHGKHFFLTGSLNLFPKTSLKTQLQHHLLCKSFLIPIHWYPGHSSIAVLVIYQDICLNGSFMTL